MSKYNGVIGSLQKSIFNEAAKNADNTYKLGQGVAKFAAGGALAGSVGTSSMTIYNNYSEGKNLTSGLGMSAIRGAALGTVVGAGANVAPKLVHNSMTKTGITTFDGMSQLVEEFGETWAPVVASLKLANHRPKTADGKKSAGVIDKYIKFSRETRKELEASGIKDLKHNGDFAYKLFDKAITGIDPKNFVKTGVITAGNTFSLDDVVKLASVKNSFGKAMGSTTDVDKRLKSLQELSNWIDDTQEKIRKLSNPQKAGIGSALLANVGFKSTYHHIVEPTADFFKNIRKGNFKNITWEQVAGTAFSGYGLYETGHILNDAAEGDVSGVALGLGILAGSKLAYGIAMDSAKFDAIRRAKGISYGNMWQAAQFSYETSFLNFKDLGLSNQQIEKLGNSLKAKGKAIASYVAPDTTKVFEEIGETLSDPNSIFTDNLKAGERLLKATVKDAKKHGKDPKQIVKQFSKYTAEYSKDARRMAFDVLHSNTQAISEWNTKYTGLMSQLKRDFMNESVDINYDNILKQLSSRDKSTQLSGAMDLLHSTKAFAKREQILKDMVGNSNDPWAAVRKPGLWLELAGDFAIGAGTTYATDYLIRGEDASIPGAILFGGGMQIATGAHILGNPKKYFAKPTTS